MYLTVHNKIQIIIWKKNVFLNLFDNHDLKD